jgi:protein-tyrosine phosphatase
MTQVRSNLYIGNYDDAATLRRPSPITAVLNVAADCDDSTLDNAQFRHVKVGLTDDPQNPPYMIELAVVVLGKLLDCGETVLIHCAGGRSRSPHIASLYLAEIEKRTYDAIWQQLRSLRPKIQIRSNLLQ